MASFLENILHLNFIEPIGKRIILVPKSLLPVPSETKTTAQLAMRKKR